MQNMEQKKANTGRAVNRTCLDLLESGSVSGEEFLETQKVKRKKVIPEGITKKMILGDITKLAWPSFIELMLTQLTSMADMMMVGQLGAWAVSAVGLTTQPKFLVMTMTQAMNVGATALVARSRGAGNQKQANNVFKHAMLLTVLFSLIFSTLGYIFSEPMIRFMGGDGDARVLSAAVDYLRIQMVGFVFFGITTTITASLRGIGDSRTAMIYNLTANVVNVIMNYLLIYGKLGFPALGVRGASIATVIGQTTAFVIAAVVVLRGKRYLKLDFKEKFHLDKDILANISKIGLPSMIEQLIMRAGMIIYTKTVASLGTMLYATHNICMNIQALSFMNGQAFAVSATSLMGQSLGKRRPDMAEIYTTYTRRIGMSVSIFLAVMFVLFGRQITSLYISPGDEFYTEILDLGGKILMLVALVQPLQSSQFIVAGALRGAGDTKYTAAVMFITTLVIRTVLALVTINLFNWGLWGAWIALVVDQALRSMLILFRFNTGKWKFIKLRGSV